MNSSTSTWSTLTKLSLALALCSASYTSNAGLLDQFSDPQDGRMDASQFILDNATGFLPMPIMVTDPAVGVGGGGALLFFHESEQRKQARLAGEEVANIPSSVSGLVGLATDNGTKVYGGFHSGNWFDDKVRYLGGLFKADVNLKYNLVDSANVEVNSDAVYFFQDIDVRLGESNFFAGASYTYMATKNSMPLVDHLVGEPVPQELSDSDIAFKLTYDNRDHQFAPNVGTKAGVKVNYHSVNVHDGASSGDDKYTKYHGYVHNYRRLSDKWGLALRGDVKRVEGDYTFYARPFVDLRGIAAMSIQASNTAVAEVEVSYDIDDRWTVLGFTGAGAAFENDTQAEDLKWHQAGGAGFRYLIARQLGLTTGLDVATGPKETAVYIQFGGAW
ncbi:glyceraldehyde-3-phosphate dehydrogenase [Vibrio sinaloensis]|uniref:glyceraldehyde-3-phosphate dehydrogenase n=1 Tax=Photobacterium sp. (strain ATCC 43367) TaxID=379097 RepID=UPI002067D4B2|nr:glyceraldehyde-3-phosphate dehydrogenase [Vibrio sinaloensis]UPQ89518.1 glyceraldehyde-3-phosphate dehydrogenase [Vibrio sinaloensis]